MKNGKRTRLLTRGLITLALAIMLCVPLRTLAEGDAKLMQSCADDASMLFFVKGLSSLPEGEFQIGNRAKGTMQAASLRDANVSVRTLIMVDNSMSVAAGREQAISLLQAVISAHLEGEQMRLAVFGDGITYLTDYTDDYLSLYNAVPEITFENRETYLTDVLLPLLEELAAESGESYTRLLIVTDGVDNKELGLTREELKDVLQIRSFPVYTAGVRNGTASENDDLEALFSLSRMTNAAYGVLGEDAEDNLLPALLADGEIAVYRAALPAEAMDGSVQNVQLSFSDGTRFSTQVRMPYLALEDAPQTTAEAVTPETADTAASGSGATAGTEEVSAEGSFLELLPLWGWIAAGAGVLLLLILVIALAARRGKKKRAKEQQKNAEPLPGKKTAPLPASYAQPQMTGADDDAPYTEFLYGASPARGAVTEMLPTGGGVLQIRLEDVDHPGFSFTEAVTGSVIVGRSAEKAQIAVTYDGSVSREQCRIYPQGGQLFAENLSKNNITKLNDTKLFQPSPLHDGDILTFGRVRMRVSIL